MELQTRTDTRAAWAMGDYHRFAKALMWDRGADLVAACGIHAGQRVLDVAAGTGNVALQAAATGAEVVASDVTPEHFAAGRAEAAAAGEDHVRELLGDGVASLDMTRHVHVERAASPTAYCAFFNDTFGPIAALRAAQPERAGDLDRDLLAYATAADRGAPGGPAEFHYEYLLVVARRA